MECSLKVAIFILDVSASLPDGSGSALISELSRRQQVLDFD
jgi:hypothetical protein